MKHLVKIAVLSLLVTTPALAENKNPDTRADKMDTKTESASESRADNTDRNEADRSGNSKTSGDQGSSEMERNLAANIRKSLVDNDTLSTYAKNVKIIVADGAVTLRGPVRTDAERAAIEQSAKKFAGNTTTVVNELEVAPK